MASSPCFPHCIRIPSASAFSVASPPPSLSSPCFPHCILRTPLNAIGFKNGSSRGLLMLPVKCSSKLSGDAERQESEAKSSLSDATAAAAASSSSANVSTYRWCAGLGGLGFLESSYLTFLKITNSYVFCPIGGGSCGDVLNSDYAAVFGVPLPLIGMAAYGFVTVLGLQLAGTNLPFRVNKTNGRMLLLGSTTSMATASAIFFYILNTKFSGVACLYCLLSATLSLSLLFITVKDFELRELQKGAGMSLCIASLVIATLSASYNASQPLSTSLAEADLRPFTTEISTESSPLALSLARHLQFVGAKMYGAFWCSHCIEQKQMFGREASKLLDYVECFPNGYGKGVKMEKACADVGIQGFPTWVIHGQVLNGEQEFAELARVSGFSMDDLSQGN